MVSLASLARMVLLNQTKTAERLLAHSELAKQHLCIQKGTVFFKSQVAFDADLAIAKRRRLSDQKAALEKLDVLAPNKNTKKKMRDSNRGACCGNLAPDD